MPENNVLPAHPLLTLGAIRHVEACRPQVFDLGADGAGRPHQVAEVPNFQKVAAAAGNGRDIFSGRTPADRKGAAVAHIAVIPPTQSVRCASAMWVAMCPRT